jgi:membrane-associated phospholipid phosphatase
VRGTSRLLIPLLAGAGVGASRVFLGVHWPSDVLAAWLFAEGWLGLAESVRPAPGRSPEGSGGRR